MLIWSVINESNECVKLKALPKSKLVEQLCLKSNSLLINLTTWINEASLAGSLETVMWIDSKIFLLFWMTLNLAALFPAQGFVWPSGSHTLTHKPLAIIPTQLTTAFSRSTANGGVVMADRQPTAATFAAMVSNRCRVTSY